MCEDEKIVRDIFWAHHDSMKLFNTFSSVLIIYSTYKTNNYSLLLLNIIGVTSIKITYSANFAFLNVKKWIMLHGLWKCVRIVERPINMSHVIVTYCNTTLMNSVAKKIPKSYVLFCKYHITKNVISRLKHAVGTKQIKSEDGKMVKPIRFWKA